MRISDWSSDVCSSDLLPGAISRFIWLRRIEPGNNSAAANRLLDRLEFLRAMNLNDGILAGVPPHRVARLRRQGERYFADGLRDLGADRRRAIMAVCVRSEEHTSELQSLMRISYAAFCLQKKKALTN